MLLEKNIGKALEEIDSYLRGCFLLAALLSALCIAPLEAAIGSENSYVILRSEPTGGMFHVLSEVLNLAKDWEHGGCGGMEVDFAKEGLYYSPLHGDNWFTYYFEPIAIGNKINICFTDCAFTGERLRGERSLKRVDTFFGKPQMANQLITKYLKMKPEIEALIDQFAQTHFSGFYVISVHYRGTDKASEAPRVSYEAMSGKVNDIIKTYAKGKYKVFIATDEQDFLDYMIATYGDAVCYNEEAIRSVDQQPIHTSDCDRYQAGLDAIVDAYLLARGQYLIRTSSNLSRWSTYLNVALPVYEMSARHNSF